MKKIMLIDDEAPLTRIMQMAIESTTAYQVTVVNDPLDAAIMVQEFQPDLIFLDVIMPGMNGLQVAEQLKSNEATRDIPLVFLSATVAKVNGVPMVDTGDGVFQKLDNELIRDLPLREKPVSDDVLFGTIQEYIGE